MNKLRADTSQEHRGTVAPVSLSAPFLGATMNPLPTSPLQRTSANLFGLVKDDLEDVEGVLARALQNRRPGVDRLLVHLSHYRGKRLRPALLLLVARACGQVDQSHHVLAAVVEMIHTATLVHDDVLDAASVRRHVPTVNALWGNQTSIMLGDYLFTHAFHLSSTLDDVRACRIIGESTNRLCAGELHQLCRKGVLELSEDEYFDIIDGKTAELTACACKLGAMYAGADEITIERMTRYGRALGMAFQIADDLLDIMGEETLAGKSLGTDLDQQKLTLPLIHLLSTGDVGQVRRVRQLLETPGHASRDAILGELRASSAIEYTRDRALAFAREAAEELTCLSSSLYKIALEKLTERVVHREC